MGMRRFAMVLPVALAAVFPYIAVAAEPRDAELAEGAAIAAACRLGKDAGDNAGLQLLAFALAMDPDSERALLLQAKRERGQPFDDVELADGGHQFVAFLEEAATSARPKARSLLLYRVIELVDPTHERALLELTRAKNQGIDTDFDALLRAARTRDREAAKPAEGAPKASEKPRDLLDALAAVTYQPASSSNVVLYTEPMYVLNQLNRQLHDSGLAITVQSKTRAVETYNDGQEMQSSAFRSRNYRSAGYSSSGEDPLAGATGRQVVWLVCALHDLGWQQQGSRLVLVDSADASGAGSGTLNAARALAAQAKKSQVDFLKAYKGKVIGVAGVVSGVGKGDPPYVHLSSDQVRVYLGTKVPEDTVARLNEEYDRAVKADRGRRDDDDGRAYYAAPRALLFVGEARCDGVTSGRVVLKACSDFALLRTNPAGRD